MARKILKEDKYYDSGLYKYYSPFYKQKDLEWELYGSYVFLHYNLDLLKETEEEMDKLVMRNGVLYFIPLAFDEIAALKCGLIPFICQLPQDCKQNLLALTNPNSDNKSYPELDAYQVLTHHTIDRNSTFFTDKEHFTSIVGKDIVERMEKILYEEKFCDHFF